MSCRQRMRPWQLTTWFDSMWISVDSLVNDSGCLQREMPTVNGRSSAHFRRNMIACKRGGRKNFLLRLRPLFGSCASAPVGVNCPTVVARGTAHLSATHAGKATEFGTACSNCSPSTQITQQNEAVCLFTTAVPQTPPGKRNSARKHGLHFSCKIVYILSGRRSLLR